MTRKLFGTDGIRGTANAAPITADPPIHDWTRGEQGEGAEPSPAALAQIVTWILGGMTLLALLLVIAAFLFAREVPEEESGA